MSAQIRELILEKTFILLLEKGYERISVSDIQESLNISRGLLYRYFKNKEDLVVTACRKYFVDRFIVTDAELKKLSYLEFLTHMHKCMIDLLEELEKKYGLSISVAKYNILYADIVMRCDSLKEVVLTEFPKARVVIENAKAKGEIRSEFSTEFLLDVAFDILTRVTSSEQNEAASRNRILADIHEFYIAVRAPQIKRKNRRKGMMLSR